MPRANSGSDVRWAQRWRARWDRQQERYLPDREERFDAILDVLEHAVAVDRRRRHHNADHPFRFLDLGGGTGALSERILRRFPHSRAVAVDFDPVLMRLGRTALPQFASRLAWVEVDLRNRDWTSKLPPGRFDAAVSTTALHWLTTAELARVYRAVAGRIRPRGVLVNGDGLRYGREAPFLGRWAQDHRTLDHAHARDRGEEWSAWWAAVVKDPRLAREAALRATRVPRHHERTPPVDLPTHRRLLARAGFREVDVAWSHWENRVLVAVR